MRILFVFFLSVVFASHLMAQNNYNIIPAPAKLLAEKGSFTIKSGTGIYVSDAAFMPVAEMLASRLESSSGLKLMVKSGTSSSGIVFHHDPKLADEGYRIRVGSKLIEIRAKTGKAAFYALQSLLQLMPAHVFGSEPVNAKVSVPACTIEDEPRFAYRGLMLDVGRHYFPVEDVKRFIDLMSLYKLNIFHWHLTEDQGWRIEIKKYPLLTQKSSVRKESVVGHNRENKTDGKPYGGFYTQVEVKDIVAYAAQRYITVVPEIEMPGHSQAVLAAYPQFGGNPDKIYEVRTRWGVSEDVLFPREETFRFIEDVLTEVMDLFPSPYIHIGGDECPKSQWKESRFCQELIRKEGLKDEHELQSWFIRRVDKFISSKGRKLFGWDEILEGGLSPNATVMSWRGTKGGIEAAKHGHDVVMSPNTHFYFDYYQDTPAGEPLAIGGNLPLSKVYSFEPYLPELTPEEAKHVIGVQANVWTEYIKDLKYAEYMTYPRALAMSEVAWSPKGSANYDGFKKRLTAHLPVFDMMKVNYSKAFLAQ
jgi:hexosaminidase